MSLPVYPSACASRLLLYIRINPTPERETVHTMQFCDNGVRRYRIRLRENLLHYLAKDAYHASSVVGFRVMA